MRSPAISYRPLALAIASLAAMAVVPINPWAGAILLAGIALTITWHLLGTLSASPRRSLALDFDPLSARDYAEMRRRYQRD